MDALAGFFVFGVSLAAIVATTEVNGKLWWASLLGTLAAGPIVAAVLLMAIPGTIGNIEAATLAFLVPLIIMCVALSRHIIPQITAEHRS
ncbi:hypothetical protein [Paraburkholderia sp. HD33-4]|uniref:hypothetical protein n=1 Tax=Paraburkholderia sp. HD33-4 TaxID=2883242 RepID=UPI001F34B71B|nr:hypothetical protein [Paraburkholderia sp. HD33-4]